MLLLTSATLQSLRHGITNALVAMCDNPQFANSLGETREHTSSFVSEGMRLFGPTQSVGRFALSDLRLGKTIIRKGAFLRLIISSGNLDPSLDKDIETFDPLRRTRRTLTFGKGVHSCLGARISKTLAGITVEALHRKALRFALIQSGCKRDEETSLNGYSKCLVRALPQC